MSRADMRPTVTTPPTIERVPTKELVVPPRAGLPTIQKRPEALLHHVESRKPILVLLPGSESFGHWCMEWKRAAEQEDWQVDIRVVAYNHPPPVRLVAIFPWQIRRNRAIRHQLDDYIEAAIHTEKDIYIVAHSYGTFALVKYLRRMYRWNTSANRIRRRKKIAGIILISGIAKRKHLVAIRSACNLLVNDLAVDDAVPIKASGYSTPLVPFLWNPYDDIGTTGIRTDAAFAHDRYYSCGDIDRAHSHLVRVDHGRENILPIIDDGNMPPGTENGPAIAERTLFKMRIGRNIAGLVIYAVAGPAAWGLYHCVRWLIGY